MKQSGCEESIERKKSNIAVFVGDDVERFRRKFEKLKNSEQNVESTWFVEIKLFGGKILILPACGRSREFRWRSELTLHISCWIP